MKGKKTTKEEVLRVRVTAHQLQKLKAHATKHGVTVSHVIHEYIRRLPNPKGEEYSSLDSYKEMED